MALSLLAMNAVFGRFFDVLPVEAADPAALRERTGEPFFIFDVQVHYVGAGYDPDNAEAGRKGAVTKPGLLGLRQRAQRLNPQLVAHHRHQVLGPEAVHDFGQLLEAASGQGRGLPWGDIAPGRGHDLRGLSGAEQGTGEQHVRRFQDGGQALCRRPWWV